VENNVQCMSFLFPQSAITRALRINIGKWNILITYLLYMTTTKRDTAYSAFIMEVSPKLTGMSSQELTDVLSDITKKMYSEIDWAKESEIYRSVIETLSDEECEIEPIKEDEEDEEEPHMTLARENCEAFIN